MQTTTSPVRATEEISDTHARGLRRDFFRWAFLGGKRPDLRALFARFRTVNLPHRSPRERKAAYLRTRQALLGWAHHYSEKKIDAGRIFFALTLHPSSRPHADGHEEPVLAVHIFLLTIQRGRVTLEVRRGGRISHHAIERMYQRLHTSSHAVVLEELRGALYWVAMLYSMAALTRRFAVINQLPVPTPRGVLRCHRDPLDGELEVRTFTPRRRGDRFDLSVQALLHWDELPREDGKAAFAALLRHPANRWWREPYRAPAG